jgi:hypothetical protein
MQSNIYNFLNFRHKEIKNTLFQFAKYALFLFLIIIVQACNFSSAESVLNKTKEGEIEILNPEGKTISQRFSPPKGYDRIEENENSFGSYLQHFNLLPHGSKVYYFNGKEKPNHVHEAVLDIDIGKKDLQQCADAIIRLYAEYLWQENKHDEIGFHFTSGFFCDYNSWKNGKRVQVNGNKVNWIQKTSHNASYETFRSYLETVFMYAGTISLKKELKTYEYGNLRTGDILIQGGSPGHAVIVVDCAQDKDGNKLFMLAQSYMPAQNIHILKNLNNPDISPWFAHDIKADKIHTPEWTFAPSDLKRFPVIR